MSFQINDRVVCVTAFEGKTEDGDLAMPGAFPEVGQMYVVRGFQQDEGFSLGLLLAGMVCRNRFGREVGFVHYKFRKLCDIQEENRRKAKEPVLA